MIYIVYVKTTEAEMAFAHLSPAGAMASMAAWGEYATLIKVPKPEKTHDTGPS